MAKPAPSNSGASLDRELPPQCVAAIENFRAYAEGSLSMAEGKKLEAHLDSCASCNQEWEHNQQLYAVLDTTLGARQIAQDFDQRAEQTLKQTPQDPAAVQQEVGAAVGDDGAILDAYDDAGRASGGGLLDFFRDRLAAAPWWGVSVVLHGLVIALAGLISMAVQLPKADDPMITVTELAQRPTVEQVEDKKKEDVKDALASKHETPPTDPMSKELNDVVVPPDILAKAELGDHFETINPDRPDTQSAFGNPDAKMFHSEKGSDEPEGGGGTDGAVLEDSLIGVGSGSKGTGGGFGGGNGDGTGVGNGSGRGSFGNRNGGGRKLMVKRHGGNPKTEDAVDRGLEWLARNQEADGHWDHAKHGGKHQGLQGDVAMTGYALLAFLGAGHTEKIGKYKDNVKRGVAYLIGSLKDIPGKKDAARWCPLNYTNGIACMALGEAAGMGRIKETMIAAQKAINGVDDAQRQTEGTSDREAWDYGPRGNANDSSVMAWNILALKSCKVAALQVNHACFEGCLNWINAGQDLGNAAGAEVSYDYEGGMMSYRGTVANPNKGKGSTAVTAAAALCRVMIGGAKLDEPGVAGPCNLIKNKWLPKGYPFNLYFGYYATLLMFQKGGDHWKAWNDVMKKVLPDAQVKGGNDDGSWDPATAGSDEGRVMSTSLCCLMLEVYYRYAKLNPDGK